MADQVKKLLSQYIAEHREGGAADPLEYLARAEDTDRAVLAELIDAYLARSPGQAWDPEAFRGSAAERVAESFGRSLQGASGWWPALLPRLRHQARLTRAQVVERLSAALGVADREEKVGAYYHQMEQGSLDSQGVSQRVLAALGEIYGTTAEQLREQGRSLGEGPPGLGMEDLAAMARTTISDPQYADAGKALQRAEPVAPAEERDEVDDMFTGGP